jgi:hypothetical protein
MTEIFTRRDYLGEETRMTDAPLDVWLRIPDGEEESEAEANTYFDPEANGFRVDWYLTAVGLVKSQWFATYEEAAAWLTDEGFEDYTS